MIMCPFDTVHVKLFATSTQAHAVIDSRGGIWTKSAVRRRARLPINQDNETNASVSRIAGTIPFEIFQSEYLE
jgi:hypothetical protein